MENENGNEMNEQGMEQQGDTTYSYTAEQLTQPTEEAEPVVEPTKEENVEKTESTYRFYNDNVVTPPPVQQEKKGFGKYAVAGVIFGIVAAACFAFAMFVCNIVFPSLTGSGDSGSVQSAPIIAATGSAIGTETDVSQLVENVMPCVVAITQSSTQKSYSIFGYSETPVSGSGSGFIVSKDKNQLLIVTNNHVVENANKITVQFIDGESVSAEIKGTDSTADLAVIAVDMKKMKSSTKEKIKVAVLGDSTQVKVGQKAVAIGNALGYGQSVTVGYISAKDRSVKVSDESTGKQNIMTLLQTDAAINPGNSGGALLDISGKVIGINSVKYASSSVEGMGYAIPISKATPIINELMKKEVLKESEKGYLGVTGKTVSETEHSTYGIPYGAVISEVGKGGAAEAAGLKVGDIITKINNVEVKTINEIVEKVNSYKSGTTITVTIQQKNNGGYKEKQVKCKLKDSSTLDNLHTGTTNGSSGSSGSGGSSGSNGSSGSGGSSGSNGSEGSNSQIIPWSNFN